MKVAGIYARDKSKDTAAQNALQNVKTHRMLLERVNQMPKRLSLLHWNSFLKGCEMMPRIISLYSLFMFEILYSLHLRITTC